MTDPYAQSLEWLKDAKTILEKARRYREAFPDLQSLAHEQASAYLLMQTGMALDPDQVWWHHFRKGDNRRARSFTGWTHHHAPISSLTFTELWIRRLDVELQDEDADTIFRLNGFYRDGPGAQAFDAQNEVKLDPVKVRKHLWELDFANVVRERTDRFWSNEGKDLPVLLKVSFISAIESSLMAGHVTTEDRQRLWAWMGLEAGKRLSLAGLSGPGGTGDYSVRHYPMHGGGHLLTFALRNGRFLLYTPTADVVLQAFDDVAALRIWVSRQLHGEEGQSWYDSLHKPYAEVDEATRKAGLQRLRERSGTGPAPHWPFGLGAEVARPLFEQMSEWVRHDVEAGHRILVSNSDLHKQYWRHELGIAITVLSVFALGWQPLGMVLFMLGSVRLGLDIDALVNAPNKVQRNEAFTSAVCDLLVIAFSVYSVLTESTPEQWDTYMEVDQASSDLVSRAVRQRHKALLNQAELPGFEGHMAPTDEFGTPHVARQGERFYSFRHEGDVHNNLIEQYSGHMAKVNDVFSIGRQRLAAVPEDELRAFLDNLFDSMEQLPRSGAKVLWRGGRGPRVTIGARWRAGAIRRGDVLVSTDITSFTESPYIPRRFMLPKEAVDLPLAQVAEHFDDNTVLYELLVDGQASGVPVASLSLNWQEAEVLFTPGRYFRIESAGEVSGTHYRFLRIRLREVLKPTDKPIYAMRTGLPFDRHAYLQLVQHDAVVERFFPAAAWT
ncbi:dermonecrotic toxin domain-containing protein [Pseudomonas vlassakiae]|uniref:Dermonecrotic toxin N-terminal domain-containing protein n=1 Tax=Pseudomonas vlassakiae TaxID=485888 RepID=A0A923GF88_9PSED|nr:DUF6543 domain-containing protein [Pseudomonas vlassakiae]MBV4540598.1 hypothetical protein [Pseudomonas vlassakiae]